MANSPRLDHLSSRCIHHGNHIGISASARADAKWLGESTAREKTNSWVKLVWNTSSTCGSTLKPIKTTRKAIYYVEDGYLAQEYSPHV